MQHLTLKNEYSVMFSVFQVAALGAVSNIVVDFAVHKSLFIKCDGVKQLVQLSKSMDSTIRVNAVWALRNLLFLVDKTCKEGILSELTATTLSSLICGNFDSDLMLIAKQIL